MRATLLIIGVSASTAAAQTTNSTTTCQTNFGTVTCNTQHQQQPAGQMDFSILRPSPGKSAVDAYVEGLRKRREREAMQAQAEAAKAQADAAVAAKNAAEAAQQADERHKRQSFEAAKMVSADDCAGAQSYALSVGNLVLAKQVKDYCSK